MKKIVSCEKGKFMPVGCRHFENEECGCPCHGKNSLTDYPGWVAFWEDDEL